MNENSKIRRVLKYFFRDELDVRHKITNVTALTSIFLMLVSLIGSVIIKKPFANTVLTLIIVTIFGLLLLGLNRHPNAMWNIFALCAVEVFLVAPFFYFSCGGKECDMCFTMILCMLFCVVLLRGFWRFLMFFMSVLMYGTCVILEYFNPHWVYQYESVVIIIAFKLFYFVTMGAVMAFAIAYQAKKYEEEHAYLKEKEAQLEEANMNLELASKAKSRFLANMSHEIRTPINAILGMDEMILRDSRSKEVIGYADDIYAAGKQLLSIINDILDFSKIESGKFEIRTAEYEVFSLINDCYNLVVRRAESKSLKLVVKNDPEIPTKLCGDEMRIKQIVTNLLSNAVKYTHMGEIDLTFSSEIIDDDNLYFIVSVKDTGIGISKENIEKLFDSFTRIDETEHRNIEGTGLGLAITKQLVELMNGTISVESVIREGSVFTVKIPQRIASKEKVGLFDVGMNITKKEREKYKAGFTAPNANVLVVDDVKVNLNVVRLLLRDTKIQMDFAESGREALNLMQEKHYDIVLMDHMMPEMDGIETLKEARKICPENIDTPMIALTANAITGAREMYEEAGFEDYVKKPIQAKELEEKIIKFLPKKLVKIRN